VPPVAKRRSRLVCQGNFPRRPLAYIRVAKGPLTSCPERRVLEEPDGEPLGVGQRHLFFFRRIIRAYRKFADYPTVLLKSTLVSTFVLSKTEPML